MPWKTNTLMPPSKSLAILAYIKKQTNPPKQTTTKPPKHINLPKQKRTDFGFFFKEKQRFYSNTYWSRTVDTKFLNFFFKEQLAQC